MEKHYIISRVDGNEELTTPTPSVKVTVSTKRVFKTFDDAVEQAKRETNRFRTQGYDHNYGVYALEAVTKVPVPEIEMIKVT